MHGQSELYRDKMRRTEWFRRDRFGMFIHFGLYSIPARGEWVRSAEQMPEEKYLPFFAEFNPVHFDASAWAATAKRAGMRYAVLTTKHHDGFCLFDSQATDLKVTRTPFQRDIVAEYVDALRTAGLKVGLYYSLVDWHHPDYPAWGDRQHPMRQNPAWKDRTHLFSRYVDYLHEQVRELCTKYGKIDILWFDFSYNQYKGEAWRATDLVRMVRKLQPDVIIDNRLGGNMYACEPDVFAGDFDGPEHGIPREPIRDDCGNPLPWEACITMNNSWGYTATDRVFRSAAYVIRALVNCVSKGGNLLVNVGPNPLGEIPLPQQNILAEVGEWLARNGESIYGCGHADMEKPEWGWYTRKGNLFYAHLVTEAIGQMNLKGLAGKVKKARLVCDGSEAVLSPFWNEGVQVFDQPSDQFFNLSNPQYLTFDRPDPLDTVIRLEMA